MIGPIANPRRVTLEGHETRLFQRQLYGAPIKTDQSVLLVERIVIKGSFLTRMKHLPHDLPPTRIGKAIVYPNYEVSPVF
jgi:hypothetical protein